MGQANPRAWLTFCTVRAASFRVRSLWAALGGAAGGSFGLLLVVPQEGPFGLPLVVALLRAPLRAPIGRVDSSLTIRSGRPWSWRRPAREDTDEPDMPTVRGLIGSAREDSMPGAAVQAAVQAQRRDTGRRAAAGGRAGSRSRRCDGPARLREVGSADWIVVRPPSAGSRAAGGIRRRRGTEG
jgi:hypothetical protein